MKNGPRLLGWTFVGSTLFIGPYMQWKNAKVEQVELRDALAVVTNKTRPRLYCEIIQNGSGQNMKDEKGDFFPAFVQCKFKNFGAPSIAEGFQLFITNNGERIEAENHLIAEPGIILDGRLVIHSKDAFYRKCYDTPIQEGVPVVAAGLFFIRNLKRETTWREGTKLEFHFTDYLGTNYVCERVIGPNTKEFKYVPGATPP